MKFSSVLRQLQFDCSTAVSEHRLHVKHETRVKSKHQCNFTKPTSYSTCNSCQQQQNKSPKTVTPFYNGTLDKIIKELNIAIMATSDDLP